LECGSVEVWTILRLLRILLVLLLKAPLAPQGGENYHSIPPVLHREAYWHESSSMKGYLAHPLGGDRGALCLRGIGLEGEVRKGLLSSQLER